MRESPIPIVVIGVTRETALQISDFFTGTSYQLAAILDLTESPKPYQYSPHNLGVTLHTLVPRPKVLVTGTAITPEIVAEIETVWKEYYETALRGEKSRWVVVSLSESW